jgi:hypothetical protein
MASMHALALALAMTLAGAPAKPTRLKLDVKPETCVIYVDGKKRGTAAKPLLVDVTPGKHAIKVENGKDSVEDVAVVKKGDTLTWTYEFTDDRPGKSPAGSDDSGKPSDSSDQEMTP